MWGWFATVAMMTGPSPCWVVLGGGVIVDLSWMCQPSSATEQVAEPGPEALDPLTAAYLRAVSGSPYGGQLESDVRGSQRSIPAAVEVVCELKRDGYTGAQVALVARERANARDSEMEEDHWVAVAAVAGALRCP